MAERSLRSRTSSLYRSSGAIPKKPRVAASRFDTGRSSLGKSSEVQDLRSSLETERKEKTELLATVTRLQQTIESQQKQLIELQRVIEEARNNAETQAKRDSETMMAEIRALVKHQRKECQRKRQQQQRQRQQQQSQPQSGPLPAAPLHSEMVETMSEMVSIEEVVPSFAEVVRRKNLGQNRGKPRGAQQPQQQPPQSQRQEVTVSNQRQRQQQQQQQRQLPQSKEYQQRNEQLRHDNRRPARPRLDQIIFEPRSGETYKTLFEKIRLNQSLREENKGVRQGYRTTRDFIRLALNKDVDAATLLERFQAALGDLGTGRIVTEMAENLVTNMDMLVTKEEVQSGLCLALERTSVAATISIWERRDGTKRARIRLPRKDAALLEGKRIVVGYSICPVSGAPKQPRNAIRCFRCLERGHITAECHGEDRSGLCVRCGASDHRAASCINAPKCIVCGGPHRIAAPGCSIVPPQC
uniref:CCHC-type domain-containing protein n=1 Tax=Anopheles funestus TaxID=62324 RepID=A0A182RV19_ANOFN